MSRDEERSRSMPLFSKEMLAIPLDVCAAGYVAEKIHRDGLFCLRSSDLVQRYIIHTLRYVYQLLIRIWNIWQTFETFIIQKLFAKFE